MTPEVAVLLLAGICNLLLGVVIFAQNWRRTSQRLFLVLSLSVTLWAAGIAAFLHASTTTHPIAIVNTYYVAAYYIGLFMWALSRSWTGRLGRYFGAEVCGLLLLPVILLLVDPGLVATQVMTGPH